MRLDEIEKLHVLEAIVVNDFDLEDAAEELGVSKRTLYRMLIRWKLPSPVGLHCRPETTLWSEYRQRCGKIEKALAQLRNPSGPKEK